MFVDSHCHLDKLDLTEFDGQFSQVLRNAEAAQVERMLCIGVTLEDFPQMRELTRNYPQINISCGAHPLYVAKNPYASEQLREYASLPDVVAIGETGLDYYYDKESKAIQQRSFAEHIDLAVELDKPLIIHTRDAREDTLSMLREGQAQKCGGVLHCFTESLAMAEVAIADLGFYISISGIASFRNADELRSVIEAIPLTQLLIETDSPWLAPVPHRGKQNQPAYVADVARCVAEVKGISVEAVAEQTTANFYQLFQRAR